MEERNGSRWERVRCEERDMRIFVSLSFSLVCEDGSAGAGKVGF